MIIRTLLVLIALSSYSLVVNASERIVVLGMLEDVPGRYAGHPNFRAVRVLFQKSGSEWRAFRNDCPDPRCLKTAVSGYPRAITWTIGLHGRILGQVTACTPKEFEIYAEVGLQEITSTGPVPAIGERTEEFSGFLASPVLRPLTANSQPYFADPESWRLSRLPAALIAAVRLQFRKEFPEVKNCTNEDPDTYKLWLFRDEDIKLIKAYSSLHNWSLAEVRLGEYRCDGPPEDAFVDQWFAVAPGGEIRLLGEGMVFVDAGDYDNDGNSEVLFLVDRYNRGGYELFYDGFKKRAAFEFSFH